MKCSENHDEQEKKLENEILQWTEDNFDPYADYIDPFADTMDPFVDTEEKEKAMEEDINKQLKLIETFLLPSTESEMEDSLTNKKAVTRKFKRKRSLFIMEFICENIEKRQKTNTPNINTNGSEEGCVSNENINLNTKEQIHSPSDFNKHSTSSF